MSRFFAPGLAALEPYVPGEQPRDTDKYIKLNTNENPFPAGPGVRAALAAAEGGTLRLYPDPEAGGLCAAAAAAWNVEPGQVIAGNGSDELLAFCFQAFGAGGLCLPDISYGFYRVWAQLYGVELRPVPLLADFSLPVAGFAGLPGTVLIADPNAPTGLAIGRAGVEELLRQDRSRLVIVDEAYADFAADNALTLLAEYDNLLVIRTLSKGYSLAGGRVGLAVGSRELIDDLRRVKYSFNPYNVSSLAQAVGEAALRDREYFASCRAGVIKERQRLTTALRELGFIVPESSANFIFAGAHPQLAAEQWYAELRRRHILTRYFDRERIREYLRISIGQEQDNTALLSATEEILALRR